MPAELAVTLFVSIVAFVLSVVVLIRLVSRQRAARFAVWLRSCPEDEWVRVLHRRATRHDIPKDSPNTAAPTKPRRSDMRPYILASLLLALAVPAHAESARTTLAVSCEVPAVVTTGPVALVPPAASPPTGGPRVVETVRPDGVVVRTILY